jgi:hypothetical protein
MPRRAPITLVRLLAVACACLVPVASAHAAAPVNDQPSSAAMVPALGWTSLSVSQDILVGAADWTDATTGPEDADPLPSCTGAVGFRSIWYAVSVPEAAVLRVTVISTDTTRYQPVVTILDPLHEDDELACGVAATGKPGATANATAYVTPAPAIGNDQPQAATYLVRVAQVLNNSASGGLPNLTVRFAGRDVTPPQIMEHSPPKVQPKASVPYSVDATDNGSGVLSEHWEFTEKIGSNNKTKTRDGTNVTFPWQTPGAHTVVLIVKDRAGNESTYRFTTFVEDTVRPMVTFSLRPPAPGAHRLRVFVKASESVRIRLLVMQAGRRKPLLRRTVSFWGSASHSRSIQLNAGVGRGTVAIGGIARDLAGNATAIPQCVVDPVTGQGTCTSP